MKAGFRNALYPPIVGSSFGNQIARVLRSNYSDNVKAFNRCAKIITDKDIKVVVFDFDGTYVFSEDHQMGTFGGIVDVKKGTKLDPFVVAKRMLGKTETEILETLKKEHALDEDVSTLLDDRGHLYLNALKNSHVRPNMFVNPIIDAARDNSAFVVIVTNGRKKIQDELLAHYKDQNLFDAVYASDTICTQLSLKERKLAFLAQIPEMHGVKPHQVLVLEDSISTAQAAEEFGQNAVFVCHNLNAHHNYTPNTGVVLKCNYLGLKERVRIHLKM